MTDNNQTLNRHVLVSRKKYQYGYPIIKIRHKNHYHNKQMDCEDMQIICVPFHGMVVHPAGRVRVNHHELPYQADVQH